MVKGVVSIRIVKGFVQIVEGPWRYILRGPHGRFGGRDLEVFPTAQAARDDSWPNLGIARLSLQMAEAPGDLEVIRCRRSFIVVMQSRDLINEGFCYELYGAKDSDGIANTTLRASYLGANGLWRPFRTLAEAEVCAEECSRQGRSRGLPAVFSLQRL